MSVSAGFLNSPYYRDYGGYGPYLPYGGYGGYRGYGSGLYGNYGAGFGRGIFARSAGMSDAVGPTVSSGGGRFYTGKGNAFVNNK
ncbi:unnamed protein product [Toxocara canis]|uniref:Glycine rich superfamily member n=1 Tax=Toxocara canis TaxID=6265 RepID=A0A183UBI1_TOXCA|nr:unnamed protein product [Toxocara canis]